MKKSDIERKNRPRNIRMEESNKIEIGENRKVFKIRKGGIRREKSKIIGWNIGKN